MSRLIDQRSGRHLARRGGSADAWTGCCATCWLTRSTMPRARRSRCGSAPPRKPSPSGSATTGSASARRRVSASLTVSGVPTPVARGYRRHRTRPVDRLGRRSAARRRAGGLGPRGGGRQLPAASPASRRRAVGSGTACPHVQLVRGQFGAIAMRRAGGPLLAAGRLGALRLARPRLWSAHALRGSGRSALGEHRCGRSRHPQVASRPGARRDAQQIVRGFLEASAADTDHSFAQEFLAGGSVWNDRDGATVYDPDTLSALQTTVTGRIEPGTPHR